MSNYKIPFVIYKMGSKFLEYILNLEDNYIVSQVVELNAIQESIIKNLGEYISKIRLDYAYNLDSNIEILSIHLADYYDIQQKKHMFQIWREQCGGKPILISNEQNELLSELLNLATQIYPQFLVEIYSTPFGQSVLSSRIQMSSGNKILNLLASYLNAHNRLIVDENNIINAKMTNKDDGVFLGLFGDLPIFDIPDCIIRCAFTSAVLRGEISLKSFLAAVREYFNLFKSYTENQKTKFPVFIGCSNFIINEPIDISIGKIYPYSKESTYFISHEHDISKSGFIIELSYEISNEPNHIFFQSIRKISRNICLAASLHDVSKNNISCYYAWSYIMAPFNSPSKWWENKVNYQFTTNTLSNENISSFTKTVNLVCGIDLNRIDVALERIYTAINLKQNTNDLLIDAVIALEALFGFEPQIVNKISSSVAALLFNDSSEECRLIKTFVSNCYTSRSEIVHGELKTIDDDMARKLIGVVLMVLHKIFNTRPDLLNLNSKQRSSKLIKNKQTPQQLLELLANSKYDFIDEICKLKEFVVDFAAFEYNQLDSIYKEQMCPQCSQENERCNCVAVYLFTDTNSKDILYIGSKLSRDTLFSALKNQVKIRKNNTVATKYFKFCLLSKNHKLLSHYLSNQNCKEINDLRDKAKCEVKDMTIVILKINQVSSGVANIIEEILITLYRPKLNIG